MLTHKNQKESQRDQIAQRITPQGSGFIWLDMICLVSNTSHMETINASDFKARCLAILDRVQATGERVVILKRGRPVAELLPASRTHAEYPQLELKGTVIVAGDIVEPAVPEEHWESLGP